VRCQFIKDCQQGACVPRLPSVPRCWWLRCVGVKGACVLSQRTSGTSPLAPYASRTLALAPQHHRHVRHPRHSAKANNER
jgi:hypothetical protein